MLGKIKNLVGSESGSGESGGSVSVYNERLPVFGYTVVHRDGYVSKVVASGYRVVGDFYNFHRYDVDYINDFSGFDDSYSLRVGVLSSILKGDSREVHRELSCVEEVSRVHLYDINFEVVYDWSGDYISVVDSSAVGWYPE
jgi:hypothetical protein